MQLCCLGARIGALVIGLGGIVAEPVRKSVNTTTTYVPPIVRRIHFSLCLHSVLYKTMDPEVVETPQAPQAAQARPDHDAVAAAFERRLQAERERAAAAAAAGSAGGNFDGNHEKRQEFRRMIDPGILRPNPRHIALESLQVYFLCVCMCRQQQ